MQTIIRNNTNVGSKHRDTRMTGSVIKENSALNKYFFGQNFKELLTVEKFIQFQKRLQGEIIKMEVCFIIYCSFFFFNSYLFLKKFDRCNPLDGKINDIEFCEALLAYAGFSDAKKKRMLKRVAKAFKDNIVSLQVEMRV